MIREFFYVDSQGQQVGPVFFEDLKKLGSEAAVKEAGKLRQEGKDYVMQDGDIVFFRFNV